MPGGFSEYGCILKTKTIFISRLLPSLDPPKSPLRRGTLSASCPPPFEGGLGGIEELGGADRF